MTFARGLATTLDEVTASAPRLDPRLVADLERLARTSLSHAEIRRRLVQRSRELGLPIPSYEHVRRLVTDCRRESAEVGSPIPALAVEVLVGARRVDEALRIARGEWDGVRRQPK